MCEREREKGGKGGGIMWQHMEIRMRDSKVMKFRQLLLSNTTTIKYTTIYDDKLNSNSSLHGIEGLEIV